MKELVKKFQFRKIVLAVADGFIVVIAALLSNFVLTELGHGITQHSMVISIIVSVFCCVAAQFVFGAYGKLWRYFNAKDYLSCVYGIGTGILAASIFVYVIRGNLPVLYAVLHGLTAIAGVCLFRFAFKQTFVELISCGRNEAKKNKLTMIVGGGRAAKMLLGEIFQAQECPNQTEVPYLPVCVIDDDTSKIGTKLRGVPIVGTTNEIKKYVEQMHIEQIIFAIPSCLEDERKRILDICAKTEVPVKVIPFISDLIFENMDNKQTLLNQIHDIKVEDLLGREPIKFDNADIRNFIRGKVCMVTGGGGSIGSELVRQIAKYMPKQIIIVDIYENNAYDIQQELRMAYGSDLNFITLIASVRDYFRMNQIFDKYRPDIVFHAAAHKHVPLMEDSPMEAIKNNVIGTFNTATLAQYYDAEKFVMISTDKAVNPTNVMGASKRCCEMIIQYLSQTHDGKTEFVTTRFGNVLGSNGSVIPLFKRQIEQGKPVTVTHPDIIRYFMTIPEAVSLVMEAAAIADGGEIFVLDMGKPVRIVALAENLIRMYGKRPYQDVDIIFTGLRPGEKIKEELLMNEEGLRKTSNKLIFIGKQIEIDAKQFLRKLDKLREAAEQNDEEVAVQALHDMVPTFVTPEEFNRKALVKATG
ncbi:nucleoside-diphosphate sugar epimerase/dehydratase [Ruminococcus sp.]|uniref:polysaccharide biosynthesis protein n=1 Tax=Ruminococcus sp. TaxID=41978 RepID=UPI0025DE5778|nr:nucleoside-diphosphate sugar epimerase/dehydratase [Ruminococcus sp.]